MRHSVGKHIGVQHDDDSDKGSESNRMPNHKSEYRAFVADLLGGRGGDGDRLSIHHFAHHAARTIRSAHKNRIDAKLLGPNPLQTPEQPLPSRATSPYPPPNPT